MAVKPDTVLSWDAVVGAVDYEVVVVDSDGNANLGSPILQSVTTAGATQLTASVVFGGLAGGAYRWQVRALASDPANHSDYSAVANATWDPKLSAPTGLTAT